MTDPDQARAALQRANAVRFANAEIRRELAAIETAAAARTEAARLLLEEPERVGRMPIRHLLAACRQVGPQKVRRWAMVAGARSDRVKVDELTPRQRQILADQLLAWHPTSAGAQA